MDTGFVNADEWTIPRGACPVANKAKYGRIAVTSPWWKFWRPRKLITNQWWVEWSFTFNA